MGQGMFKAQVTDHQEWLNDPVAQKEYQDYLKAQLKTWDERYPQELDDTQEKQ